MLLALVGLLAGCSNNDNANANSNTTSGGTTSTPEEFPTAKGKWMEARTFMERTSSGDPNECDQIDFRVGAQTGVYTVTRCDHSKSGQVTADEFRQLDTLATTAYTKTDGMICPQIFKLDKYYALINSQDAQYARKFDPDSMCYEGDELAVSAYKNFLVQLLEKYQ